MNGLTPFHLEILIWYHTRTTDIINMDAPTVKQYIADWIRFGILKELGHGSLISYELTDKGQVYLDGLLHIPLPIQQWVMPEYK